MLAHVLFALIAGLARTIPLPENNSTLKLPVVDNECFGWRLIQPELIITSDGALKQGLPISESELASIVHVDTDLIIVDDSSLTSVSHLAGIRSVGGNVEIRYNKALENLSGLNNITSIGGSLNIISNKALKVIDAFESLEVIGGSLRINNNGKVQRVAGFSKLLRVGGTLFIRSNDELLAGPVLPLLEQVDGDVKFIFNKVMASCGLFPALETAKSLVATDNDALLEFDAFPKLRHLEGDLMINHHELLGSMRSFHNLQGIGGSLKLHANRGLHTVAGFDNLEEIAQSLEIKWSSALVELRLPMLKAVRNFFFLDNDMIENLTGLASLTNVSGNFEVSYSKSLHHVKSQVQFVGGDLAIRANENMESIELSSLETTGGSVEVSFNDNLFNVSSEVVFINGDFIVKNNGNMTSLDLPQMKAVYGDFELSYNAALQDLMGMRKIEKVRGFKLNQNHALADVSGFSQLRQIGGNMEVTNNMALEDMSGFASELKVEGDVQISENPELKRITGGGDWSAGGGFIFISFNCSERGVRPTSSSTECTICREWQIPNSDKTICETRPPYAAVLSAFVVIIFSICCIIFTTLRRKVLLENVTVDRLGRVIVKTCDRHFWLLSCEFPLIFSGTGNPDLDSPEVPLTARVVNGTELELLNLDLMGSVNMQKRTLSCTSTMTEKSGIQALGNSIRSDDALLTASEGTVVPAFPWEFRVRGVCLSAIGWISVFFTMALMLSLATPAVGIGTRQYLLHLAISAASGLIASLLHRSCVAMQLFRLKRTHKIALLEQNLLQEMEAACWSGSQPAMDAVRDGLLLGVPGWTDLRFHTALRSLQQRQSHEAGVSIAYILSNEFLQVAQSRSNKQDPNFYDLKDAFFCCQTPFLQPIGQDSICPRDLRRGCAMIDVLPRKYRRACTHFLSWTWSYTISQVRDALQVWMEGSKLDPSQTFLYMCFFVNNQYRILVDKDGAGSYELEDVFEGNLRRIGRMVALVDHWDQPVYLSRIWTIFEQFTAVMLGIEVEMILPSKSGESLIEEIRKGEEGIKLVKQSLCTVDSAHAKAWSPEDERRVKMLIKEATGFETVNAKVREFMVAWVAQVVEDYLKHLVLGNSRQLHRRASNLRLSLSRSATSMMTRLSPLSGSDLLSLATTVKAADVRLSVIPSWSEHMSPRRS